MGLVELGIIAGMIAVNSVFSGYEIALASVSLGRLQMLAGEQRPGARVAAYMKENVEASLATVQLGITLVGAIAAATGGAGAEEFLQPWVERNLGLAPLWAELLALTLVVVPLTVVTIIGGELVPKVFALRNAEWVCLTLSPTMRWFSLSVFPLVWFFETTVMGLMRLAGRRGAADHGKSEAAVLQELRASAALARTTRLIGEQQENIIVAAARLSGRPIREIALPAEHIVLLALDAPLEECLVQAHLHLHTRFPVTEAAGDPQRIVGYVNFKDIVALLRLSPRRPSLGAVLRPIPSFPGGQPITTVLEALMRERTHIALVRDEAGRVLGLVTLEDIVEELLGDIQDEYDRLPSHLHPTGTAWVAGGGVPVEQIDRASRLGLAADGPPDGARTLSEWVVGHLGRPPRGGEELTRGGVRVVVRKVRRHQVQEAQVGPALGAEAPG